MDLSRDEAREYIRSHPADYLDRDKSGKGYICPICGSGTGKNGTGITTKDGIHFTCWTGCFNNADIIDIIGIEQGIRADDYSEKLKAACNEYGIALQSGYSIPRGERDRQEAKKIFAEFAEKEKLNLKQEQNCSPTSEECTKIFEEAYNNRDKTDYLQKRGISNNTRDYFHIGYCANWKSPTALKKGYAPPESPRIIIPTSETSYIARDIRPAENLSDKEKQFIKMKEGKAHLFNPDALFNQKEPCFIVEGEIDALSIYEIDHHQAVGLGSVNMAKELVSLLKGKRPNQPLIIALDNDKPGQEAAEKLSAELDELKIKHICANIAGECKDANELLTADRLKLKENIEAAIAKVTAADDPETPIKSNYDFFAEYLAGIVEADDAPVTPTGFKELDNLIDDGLYEGLYIIGAIPSLGKTTFALQIVDNIAKSGQDVLIFSLEMSRMELMVKSLSRLTAEKALQDGKQIVEEVIKDGKTKYEPRNAKTVRGITRCDLYPLYSDYEKGLIEWAKQLYSIGNAARTYVIEGVGDISVEQIKEKTEGFINSRVDGSKPIVLIDYLQILAPKDPRCSDKQNTDKAVVELKRMSRDLKIPVIAISSFNRENYNAELSMQAFKESGQIEYGADVLIGLGIDKACDSEDTDKAKAKCPRKIKVKILKNRNGPTGGEVKFKYYAPFNLFIEG